MVSDEVVGYSTYFVVVLLLGKESETDEQTTRNTRNLLFPSDVDVLVVYTLTQTQTRLVCPSHCMSECINISLHDDSSGVSES